MLPTSSLLCHQEAAPLHILVMSLQYLRKSLRLCERCFLKEERVFLTNLCHTILLVIQELFGTLQRAGLNDASVQALQKKYGVWPLTSGLVGEPWWRQLPRAASQWISPTRWRWTVFLWYGHVECSCPGVDTEPDTVCKVPVEPEEKVNECPVAQAWHCFYIKSNGWRKINFCDLIVYLHEKC